MGHVLVFDPCGVFLNSRGRVASWLLAASRHRTVRGEGDVSAASRRTGASSTSAGSLASGVRRAVAVGLLDPVERARVAGAVAAGEQRDGAGRGQRVVVGAALRKKTRSREVGGQTRGKRRDRCSRPPRTSSRCPRRPANENKVESGGVGRRGANPEDVHVAVDNNRIVALLALRGMPPLAN